MPQNGEATVAANRPASRPTDSNRGPDGRWIRGNRGAVRHRLRASPASLIRRRHPRLNRLLRTFLEMRADQGRPVSPTQLPLAYRYIELELIATDCYGALEADPRNAKLFEMYASAVRAQALISTQLGENTPRPKGGKVEAIRDSALWQIAETRRQRERLEAHDDGQD